MENLPIVIIIDMRESLTAHSANVTSIKIQIILLKDQHINDEKKTRKKNNKASIVKEWNGSIIRN